MQLVEFLGLALKSDAIIELLEVNEVEVIYDFDRLHENQPDRYTASALSAGWELCFDADQKLKTIWCYVVPKNRFVAVDTQAIGVPMYSTLAEGRNAAEVGGLKFSQSTDDGRRSQSYIRIERPDQWHHYEYSDTQLTLVTLMLPWQ